MVGMIAKCILSDDNAPFGHGGLYHGVASSMIAGNCLPKIPHRSTTYFGLPHELVLLLIA